MVFRSLKSALDSVLNIVHQTDEEGTVKEIYDKIPVRGNNTWMLICSAVLASIGLDTGSGAVIIGAMLVSPLMSPILGIGLSVGINDREMLIDSAKNLGIAAIAGLLVSAMYFKITPLGEPTNELLARTQPTLLDVMVAFFGGVAGIVSISRSDRSNAIPGVAIATALMPPLCTAGYGLALGRLDFFFGGFYLFFINAVFISLATFLIVKYLKFHTKSYVNEQKQKRVARIMAVMVVIVVSPSIYFLFNIYKEVEAKRKIETLIIKDFAGRNNEIIKWEIQNADSVSIVKVYSVGDKIEDGLVAYYDSMLQDNALSKYRMKLVQLDVSAKDVQDMASQITNNLTRDFLQTLEIQKLQEQKADSIRMQRESYNPANAAADVRLMFPEVRKVQVGEMVAETDGVKMDTILTVMLEWPQEPTKSKTQIQQNQVAIKINEKRIKTFLAAKFKRDSLLVYSNYSQGVIL